MNSDRYAGDSKMHEMVAVAMEENWDVCLAHIESIIGVTGAVIADGVASGEFHAADIRRCRAMHADRDAAVYSIRNSSLNLPTSPPRRSIR